MILRTDSYGFLPLSWSYGAIIAGAAFCIIATKLPSNRLMDICLVSLLVFSCLCVVLTVAMSDNRQILTSIARIGGLVVTMISLGCSGYTKSRHSMKTSAKTVAGCLFFLGAMLLCEVL